MHRGVSFHLHHLRNMDAAGEANAGEIVAREVDDHEILGAVLSASGKRRAKRGVLFGGTAAADGSFDRAGFDVSRIVDVQEALGRGARDINVAKMQECRMRRRIELAKRFVICEWRDTRLNAELIGEADLVAFTGGDTSLAVGNETEIFFTFRCRREFDRRGQRR